MIIAYSKNAKDKRVESNWGDALNFALFNYLSETPCEFIRSGLNIRKNHIIGIGSIISHANSFSTIWGSGFIAKERTLKEKPFKIAAVRGPLSRDKVLELGFECPKVYGDPALLYPAVYNPSQKVKYEWGIIPHYVDNENPFLKTCKNCLIIDICNDTNTVVDQIKQCAKIASSSLHGLIAADAYRKPSVWLKFSNKIVGGAFKFHDYFKSVGRWQEDPVVCTGHTFPGIKPRLEKRLNLKTFDLDLKPLVKACPITISKQKSEHLLSFLDQHYFNNK